VASNTMLETPPKKSQPSAWSECEWECSSSLPLLFELSVKLPGMDAVRWYLRNRKILSGLVKGTGGGEELMVGRTSASGLSCAAARFGKASDGDRGDGGCREWEWE
jgi:hypothetical protein